MISTRKTLTVLHVATLNRPIKQELGYGPIETVIYNVDKGLHQLGHRSIVACSGDSRVVGERYTTIRKSFAEYWSTDTRARRAHMRRHLLMSLRRGQQGDIDIIHMHDAVMMEYMFTNGLKSPVPIVMTLHVPAEETGSFRRWNRSLIPSSAAYFVPISAFQERQHHGLVNMQPVIHHGIDVEDYPFGAASRAHEYLFSIGRITRDKGQDKAIEIARQSGARLVLAGNVQNKAKDRAFFRTLRSSIDLVSDARSALTGAQYYRRVMRPLLASRQQIIYVGEVNDEQKKLWYRHARLTLFPIQWGEPFGLVMVESMACGTPVVALRRGSVPEIVMHGKTGFVADSIGGMVEAVRAIRAIDRRECRRHVKERFSIASMAAKYVALYHRIVEDTRSCPKISP